MWECENAFGRALFLILTHLYIPTSTPIFYISVVNHFEPPMHWADHEDIAMALYEKFGTDFTEAKFYRIRFTDLTDWVLSLPNFDGIREQATEGHLEQIQAKWVYEWRDNQ